MTAPLKFWAVWNISSGPPTYQHHTKEAALAEAERLARLNPGGMFYVLEAIEARYVDSMQRVSLRERTDDDQIPF